MCVGRRNRLHDACDELNELNGKMSMLSVSGITGPLGTVWSITHVLELHVGRFKFLSKLET